MDMVTHCIYLLEEAIERTLEEAENEEITPDHEVVLPISVVEQVIKCLNSQEVKEPLEDVIFFVGKPSLDSIVYHVLCREVTFDAMRKDPNIHFMLMKKFNGYMEQDGGNRTLDEQENKTRNRLVGK